MSNISDVLVANVRFRLESLNWKAKDLAEHAGMTQAQLSDYLTGKKSPGLEVVARLANALKIPPADLLKAPGEPAKAEPAPKPKEALEARVEDLAHQVMALKYRLEARDASSIPPDVMAGLAKLQDNAGWDAIRAVLTGFGVLQKAQPAAEKKGKAG